MSRRYYVLAVLWLSISILSSPSRAQESRGNITGSVLDPQGSAISNARIEVRNVDTGVVTCAATNEDGLFEVEFLIPGHYSITADAAGFKKLIRTGVTLRVAGRMQVDLRMEVGAVSETITVSGARPLLETTNASTGRVMEGKELTEMPVAQTNPMNMPILAPDVMYENRSNTTGVTANGGNSEYRTMGGWATTSTRSMAFRITATHRPAGLHARLGHGR